jgi:hypothetical protein
VGLPAAGWAFSRWLCAQALQDLSEASRRRTKQAMEVAARVRGAGAPAGSDATDRTIKIIDHDWVFRQVYLYEAGGLSAFLRRVDPRLVLRADRVVQWAGAPMGGYQLLRRDSSTVSWRDLATDEEFTVANNGCGILLVPGEHAIGRRVPIAAGSMFETAPLATSRRVADRVAMAPDDWAEILADATHRRDGDEPPIQTHGHQFELLTDVPPVVMMLGILDDDAELAAGSNLSSHIARAALDRAQQLLDAPPDDPEELDPWACLAVAFLQPDVAAALPEVMRSGDVRVLQALSEKLAEPAASVCRTLSEAADDAA